MEIGQKLEGTITNNPVEMSTQDSMLEEPSSARTAWVENLSVVLAHKWLIAVVTLVVVSFTAFYSFLFMPNWFKASTTVLPARRTGGLLDNITGGLASTIKDLGIAKIGGGGAGEGSYSPLALLQSRELHEAVISQFGMIKRYNARNMPQAVVEFDQHVSGEVSEQGDFTISFEDTSASTAAAVANALVDGINNINSRLAVEEAKQNFAFVAQRYEKNLEDLDSAEQAFGVFQAKYGVFALPEQARAELTGIASAEQERSQAELQLHTAEQVYGPQSVEAQLLRNTISDLSDRLGQMNSGFDSKAPSYFVPTKVLPEVALQYLRLMREVEIQSKLKAFLLPTFEQAKLDQTKRTLAFVTLDHAIPPDRKSAPHRSILILVALISGVVLTSMLLIVYTNFRAIVVRFKRTRSAIEVDA